MKKGLIFAIVLLLFVAAAAQTGIKNIVVTVNDFSKGMMPILPPFQNDPEAIAYSQNMYSLQPGTRTVRSGTVELVDYDSAVGDDTILATNGVDAMALYVPTDDSSAIVFASGGKWFAQKTGRRSPTSKLLSWLPAFNTIQEVMPYTDGLYITVFGDSIKSVSSRFVRDLDVGDTFFVEDTARVIEHVIRDNKLIVSPAFGEFDATTDYTVGRYYDPVIPQPYLVQSGNYMFTGSTKKPPQVVYTDIDHNIRIRSLGLVDSFYIDSIYSMFPDSAVRWDSVGRRGWDTTAYGTKYIRQIQLVSRRKGWVRDQWLVSGADGAESYYVRIGFAHRTAFYQIAGNTDTSVYLSDWYVDTLAIDSSTADPDWNDSLFFSKGQTLKDTIPTATAEGQWGYIFASVGETTPVVEESDVDSLYLTGRAALMWTVDAALALDSLDPYDNMLFIHLTGDDVSFDAFTDSSSSLQNERVVRSFSTPTLDSNEIFVKIVPIWWCVYSGKFFYSREECKSTGCGSCQELYEYTIRTKTISYTTQEAEALVSSYFHINYIRTSGDTVFFICNIGSGLTDNFIASTARWEIVKIGMPNWSGIVEWGTPAQLVGFGDTLSPSRLSFSAPGNPWDWSVQNDLIVGDDPADPIINGVGYDDQLILFKSHSMISYPGFLEVSRSDGLVGPNAVIGLNKFLYWLDVDGVKRMQRRDFQGYSVQKISAPMDPVFNAWNAVLYGTGVVPFSINPQYRYLSQMVYNQRDGHIYLFFPGANQTKNTACLTYDLQSDKWDGYFTLGASTAMWATIRDTSRIVMGGSDSALITGLDYSYTDVGIGIDTDLKSHKFWLQDDNAWPVQSTLKRIRLLARGLNGTFDSLKIYVIGDNLTSSASLIFGGSMKDIDWVYGFQENNTSRYWQWEIKGYGKDGSAAVLVPYKLQMEFTPQKKGTNY